MNFNTKHHTFLKYFFCFVLCVLTNVVRGFSQESQIKILTNIPEKARSGDILNLTLEVKNESSSPFIGKIKFNLPKGLNLLSADSVSVSVNEQKSRFIPVRLKVDKDLEAAQHPFSFVLLNEENVIEYTLQTKIEVEAFRLLTLQVLEPMALMYRQGDSVSTKVLIRNEGNKAEKFKLVSSLPTTTLSSDRKFEEQSLYLNALSDTLLELSYYIDRNFIGFDRFTINYTGLYENSDVFGNGQFSVQNTSSKRTYTQEFNPVYYYNTNQLTLLNRNIFNENPYLSLYGGLNFERGKETYTFNINLNQNGFDSRLQAYNTWFRYDHNNIGFTIGNLNENEEMLISGRGAKVHFGDSARNHTTEIGWIEKSYSLLDPIPQNLKEYGTNFFAKTSHIVGNQENQVFSSLLSYDQDSRIFSESFLFHNKFEGRAKNTEEFIRSYKFVLGFGMMKPSFNPDGSGFQENASFHYNPSLALGASVHGEKNSFYTSTNTYLSGGYYPGTQRGATQLQQRIGARFSKLNIWADYQYNEYSPLYYFQNNSINSFFKLQRSELGVNFNINPFITLTLGPRWEAEEGMAFISNAQPTQYYMENLRLFSQISWRSRNYKRFGSLQNETGFPLIEILSLKNNWNTRTQFNYNLQSFNFSAIHQKGAFNVSDLIYSQILGDMPEKYSGTIYWQNSFFNNLFTVNLNGTYYHDKFYGSSQNLNSRLQFRFNKTEIFSYQQLSFFSVNGLTTDPVFDAQIGITQHFNTSKSDNSNKKGKIRLKFFYDHNKNGIFDEGDEWANRKSVLIKNTLFLTDQKGEIEYRKLPYGAYSVQVPIEENWYANPFEILLNKSQHREEIPLRKSATLRGKIRYEYDFLRSLETEIVLEGLTVIIKNEKGEEFRTRTDNTGSFLIYVPEGTYTISLIERQLPTHVYPKEGSIVVKTEPGTINIAPDYILNIKEKAQEIKRFGT